MFVFPCLFSVFSVESNLMCPAFMLFDKTPLNPCFAVSLTFLIHRINAGAVCDSVRTVTSLLTSGICV